MSDLPTLRDDLTLEQLKEWLEKQCVDCLFSRHKYYKGALKLVDWHLDIKKSADEALRKWMINNE